MKHFFDITVYDATQKRLRYIFNEFDHIDVAFSGGKDSGLLLNLTYEYAAKRNLLSKLSFHFLDYEAQYQYTIAYVKRMFDKFKDVDRFWLCLPLVVPSSTSMQQGYWIPWNEKQKQLWVRPMPVGEYVINENNAPFAFEPGISDYDFQEEFNSWLAQYYGKTAILIAIRAAESLTRFHAITSHRKTNSYKQRNYLINKGNHCNGYPIYDWQTKDIWIANAKGNYDYNRLYDQYYYAGIPVSQMRVASPFLSEGIPALKYYQVIEPDTWAKLLGRVNGVNFSGLYGSTTAMGWQSIKLPPGMTWKRYVYFLLSTLPPVTRQNYEQIFAKSVHFWKNRGGVLSPKTIHDLQRAGINCVVKGKTNYHTDKEAVVFPQYPDDAPIKDFRSVPSYKRMAITIMKNDVTAKYMGFARTKKQTQQRQRALKKYANLQKQIK